MAGIDVCAGLPAVCAVSRICMLTVKQLLYLYLLQVNQQRQPSLSGMGVTDIDLQLTEEEREAVRTLALILFNIWLIRAISHRRKLPLR